MCKKITFGSEHELKNSKCFIEYIDHNAIDRKTGGPKSKNIGSIWKNGIFVAYITIDNYEKCSLYQDRKLVYECDLELSTNFKIPSWEDAWKGIVWFTKKLAKENKIKGNQKMDIQVETDVYSYMLNEDVYYIWLKNEISEDTIQFASQYTVGYPVEYVMKAFDYPSTENINMEKEPLRECVKIWFSNKYSELDVFRGKLECVRDRFVLDFLMSILDFSIYTYFCVEKQPITIPKDFCAINQNHTDNKNAWAILPRASMLQVLKLVQNEQKLLECLEQSKDSHDFYHNHMLKIKENPFTNPNLEEIKRKNFPVREMYVFMIDKLVQEHSQKKIDYFFENAVKGGINTQWLENPEMLEMLLFEYRSDRNGLFNKVKTKYFEEG